MKNSINFFSLIVNSVILFTACNHQPKDRLFTKLPGTASGIHFKNDIHDRDSSYSFINEFGYMGGGVGIGDFNNDGLKDIVFTANQVSSRLYINQNNLKFKDITEGSGFTTKDWATGVSIVDINGDGFDDIYVCTYGKGLIKRSPNLLFVNQGDLTFKEMAVEYGIADTGYSSQAAFLDYDRDGDLDLYIANYSFSSTNGSANNIVMRDFSGKSIANDKLYRNDGISQAEGHPVYTDVSMQAGISEDGYGLGVTISDFNNDGWLDIYVANDFVSNDCMWQNNHDGTFTNIIAQAIRHQSYSSMGVDAADLNNDGLTDIVTLDMLPEDNERRKTSFFFMNYDRYQAERYKGYEPEYMRNMLQLNNGLRYRGDTAIPFFSEIGQMAGIAATDWSWSVLLADYNHDGYKDMHITNGIGRDFINADFLEFSSEVNYKIADSEKARKAIKEKLASLNTVELPNYLYLGSENHSYRNATLEAGIAEPSMSNGAAYADLDNDGDMEIIINNINADAFVLINNSVQVANQSNKHFLKIRLQGPVQNNKAFGAKVTMYRKGILQQLEQNPVRGYYSSVDTDLIFGFEGESKIDSLVTIWPDGMRSAVYNPLADTILVCSYKNAKEWFPAVLPAGKMQKLFTGISDLSAIDFVHIESNFNDFAVQRMLPQKFSQLGPFMTSGDVNGDGLIDFFVGGSGGYSGKFFLQQRDAKFRSVELVKDPKKEEDMACKMFDADNDGDLDLLVTHGDVQATESDDQYQPKLWLNDGKGSFTPSANAIPANVKTIGGAIATVDIDGDGYLDVFIGGRVSHQYPVSPRSYLLKNKGGVFSDITEVACPQLTTPGMVTSAVFADYDGDKKPDLILAGDWMAVRFFKNTGGKFLETTASTGIGDNNGMWRSLSQADLDGDGDLDIIAGNLGQNCIYAADSLHPMELFATDLDKNGNIDPVLFYHIKTNKGKRYLRPAISRSQFAEQVPSIKKKFLLAKDYAHAGVDEIFTAEQKKGILSLKCEETRSCWFENLGSGRFKKHPLPAEAQFAPVNAIVCSDVDGDGFMDLILAGNEYQTDVFTGRYDASYGCFLRGSISKNFKALTPVKSGLILEGDVKSLLLIPVVDQKNLLVSAANNSPLQLFEIGMKMKGN